MQMQCSCASHLNKHSPHPAPPAAAEFLHVKPGKGSAFVRSKLKNFITNNTVEKTWRAGESVDMANVEKKETQFTYAEGDEVGGVGRGGAGHWKGMRQWDFVRPDLACSPLSCTCTSHLSAR